MSERAFTFMFTVAASVLTTALMIRIAVAIVEHRMDHRAPYYVCQSQPGGGIIIEASDPRNVGERCDI